MVISSVLLGFDKFWNELKSDFIWKSIISDECKFSGVISEIMWLSNKIWLKGESLCTEILSFFDLEE